MPDDPRAKLFFDQWEKDTHEGITLRSVHNRLTGHMDRTEERFRNQSAEMKRVGERIAAVEQNDKRDAEDRANNPGRHNTPGGVVIPTPVHPFPVPYPSPSQPGAVVHVHGAQGGSVGGDYIGPGAQVASGTGSHIIAPPAMVAAATAASHEPRRVTWPPSWLKPPIQKAVGYGLTALAAAGVTLVVHTAAAPAVAPPERVVYLPAPVEPSAVAAAPSSPEAGVAAVAVPAPPTSPAMATSLPAGPPPHRSAK